MSYNKFYVYSKDGCGFCDKLTNFMESKGVEFEKFDLSKISIRQQDGIVWTEDLN